MIKSWIGFVLAMLLFVGCESAGSDTIKSEASMSTTEVKGESKNCAVVLKAQQGISYSANVVSDGDWALFSNGETHTGDTMQGGDKILYIYFDKNDSGESREARISVQFSDGESFEGSFTQLSYDSSVALTRRWAELPECKASSDYIYNTHYGQLGTNSNARNYTYCFAPEYRAALWVAYPLHKSHTSGSGNRNNSDFGYDPSVSTSYQANLGAGSYSGWYDRGHQLPAADRKCSQQMMDQTFYATNMTPQQGKFNQNKWGVLEGKVRNMTCADTLFVVTGAWFGGEHDSSIDSSTTDKSGNRCPTPTHYYKALLRTSKGNTGYCIDEVKDAAQLRAIVFWLEHANTGDNTTITASDCITVNELERITGFDFFPMIDDSIEAAVESSVDPSLWGIN
ncbi:MAG: DNA/RNA non-specific endonuclease [Alistipes sp.]|nr:DNA/RNA non-specific endonuclease [Alistipes sp.]